MEIPGGASLLERYDATYFVVCTGLVFFARPGAPKFPELDLLLFWEYLMVHLEGYSRMPGRASLLKFSFRLTSLVLCLWLPGILGKGSGRLLPGLIGVFLPVLALLRNLYDLGHRKSGL